MSQISPTGPESASVPLHVPWSLVHCIGFFGWCCFCFNGNEGNEVDLAALESALATERLETDRSVKSEKKA